MLWLEKKLWRSGWICWRDASWGWWGILTWCGVWGMWILCDFRSRRQFWECEEILGRIRLEPLWWIVLLTGKKGMSVGGDWFRIPWRNRRGPSPSCYVDLIHLKSSACIIYSLPHVIQTTITLSCLLLRRGKASYVRRFRSTVNRDSMVRNSAIEFSCLGLVVWEVEHRWFFYHDV